jgi:hypothetical protein
LFSNECGEQHREQLDSWLLEHKLDEYHERLVAEGVTELDDFKELECLISETWAFCLNENSLRKCPASCCLPQRKNDLRNIKPLNVQFTTKQSKPGASWRKRICLFCIAEDHHGHKCENLQSAAESARKEISSSCDSARQMRAKTVACKAAIENSTARVGKAGLRLSPPRNTGLPPNKKVAVPDDQKFS